MIREQVLINEIINWEYTELLEELRKHFRIDNIYELNSIIEEEDCSFLFGKSSVIWIEDRYKGFILFYPNGYSQGQIRSGGIILFHLREYSIEQSKTISDVLSCGVGESHKIYKEDLTDDEIWLNQHEKYMVILRRFDLTQFMMEYDQISGIYLSLELNYYFNQLRLIHDFTIQFCLLKHSGITYSKEGIHNLKNSYHKSLLSILYEEFNYGIGKTPNGITKTSADM